MPQQWNDIEDLHEAMRDDAALAHLRKGRNPLVPGEGAQPAGVIIVGEAPGADEVMALRPFVGASGKVLRQLMAFADLDTHDQYEDGRDSPPTAGANCWLTNAVKYRPPRNRTPTWAEVEASRPYLMNEFMLVGNPTVVVAVGAVALSAIVGTPMSISTYAGCGPVHSVHGRTLWPMFHPAYGLHGNDTVKALIESHWQNFAEWLYENNPG